MIYAVLASGPSMTQVVADSVRGRCKVIAVSDAWQLAPWADALVSVDAGWWRIKSPEFNGPKYSMSDHPGTERLKGMPMGTNSGLVAVHLAVTLGATKVLLFGVDLKGSHFFGLHKDGLRNPTKARLEVFKQQFNHYKPKGVEILNCNPDSALTCYPLARVGDHLEGMAESAAPDSGTDDRFYQRAERPGLRSPVRGHVRARSGGRVGQLEPDKGRGGSG